MATPDPDLVRLRLAPHAVVLRRGPGELQVGVEPAVVVPERCAELLTVLSGTTTRPPAVRAAVAAGVDDEEARAVLHRLGEAGLLLVDDGSPAPLPAVRLVGASRLARRTAAGLAATGATRLYLAELARAGPGVTETCGPDRLTGLVALLRRRHPTLVVERVGHWTKPETTRVDLTVVVADGPEADRLVTDTLLGLDAPHLVLRTTGAEVTVGPLVLPGRTSCVRCADLVRCDRDPRWPWVLAQLTRVRLDPDPALLAWAAACATAQVLAFLTGSTPESAGHTLELASRDHALRLRAWPVRGDCGCRWPGSTE